MPLTSGLLALQLTLAPLKLPLSRPRQRVAPRPKLVSHLAAGKRPTLFACKRPPGRPAAGWMPPHGALRPLCLAPPLPRLLIAQLHRQQVASCSAGGSGGTQTTSHSPASHCNVLGACSSRKCCLQRRSCLARTQRKAFAAYLWRGSSARFRAQLPAAALLTCCQTEWDAASANTLSARSMWLKSRKYRAPRLVASSACAPSEPARRSWPD